MPKQSKPGSNKATPVKKAESFAKAERARMKQEFLDKYPDYGTIYHTALAVGTKHPTVEDWLNEDAAFAEAFKTIRKAPGYLIERSAMQRCIDKGVQAD